MKVWLFCFIKCIYRILKNKDTYSILGNIATIIVAILPYMGIFIQSSQHLKLKC